MYRKVLHWATLNYSLEDLIYEIFVYIYDKNVKIRVELLANKNND